jgi:AraC-like DNA-binding protein
MVAAGRHDAWTDDEPRPPLLAVRKVGFRIWDVEAALAAVGEFYDVRPKVIGRPESCRFELSSVSIGDLSVDRLDNSLNLEVDNSVESVLISLVRRQGYSISCGGEEWRPGPGDVSLLPVAPRVVVSSREGLALETLRVPLAHIRRFAEVTFGVREEDFRFEGMAPVSPATNSALLKTLTYIQTAVQGPEPLVCHPLVQSAVLDMAAAAALAAFPNNAATTGSRWLERGQVRASAVRRAVDFIEANAGRPVSLADIAAATGTSARSLRAGFHRHLGVSPMDFLRRTRLERAHRDLQGADPDRGETVTAIARRWGFASPGRFAADYRHVYGCPPRRTLGKS